MSCSKRKTGGGCCCGAGADVVELMPPSQDRVQYRRSRAASPYGAGASRGYSGQLERAYPPARSTRTSQQDRAYTKPARMSTTEYVPCDAGETEMLDDVTPPPEMFEDYTGDSSPVKRVTNRRVHRKSSKKYINDPSNPETWDVSSETNRRWHSRRMLLDPSEMAALEDETPPSEFYNVSSLYGGQESWNLEDETAPEGYYELPESDVECGVCEDYEPTYDMRALEFGQPYIHNEGDLSYQRQDFNRRNTASPLRQGVQTSTPERRSAQQQQPSKCAGRRSVTFGECPKMFDCNNRSADRRRDSQNKYMG